MKLSKVVIPSVLAVASTATMIGTAVVSADTTSTNTSSSATTSQTAPPERPKDGGTIVTDDTVISSVTSAVDAKYSGSTIDRVAKLPDGSYLAFTRQSDNKVIVSLDSNFAVTDTKQVPANAPKDGQQPKDGQTPPDQSSSSSTSQTTN